MDGLGRSDGFLESGGVIIRKPDPQNEQPSHHSRDAAEAGTGHIDAQHNGMLWARRFIAASS